jgi:hypothetical protein
MLISKNLDSNNDQSMKNKEYLQMKGWIWASKINPGNKIYL